MNTSLILADDLSKILIYVVIAMGFAAIATTIQLFFVLWNSLKKIRIVRVEFSLKLEKMRERNELRISRFKSLNERADESLLDLVQKSVDRANSDHGTSISSIFEELDKIETELDEELDAVELLFKDSSKAVGGPFDKKFADQIEQTLLSFRRLREEHFSYLGRVKKALNEIQDPQKGW
jgi:hypothetical protein